MTTINLLFSMVGPLLDDETEAGFRNYAQWTVIGERNGRLFVDAIGEAAMVGGAFMALDYLGRDPIAIGAWTADGEPVEAYPFNLAAWCAIAPPNDDGTPTTEWREIHRWAGWAEKQLPA